MVIGIDPGVTGAVVPIHSVKDGPYAVFDMPTMPRTTGKGNQVNPYELANLLRDLNLGYTTVFLEYVNARPGKEGRGMGAQSAFNFGEGYGVILGVTAALGIPLAVVTPQEWKAHAGLIRKPKEASRALALQRWPGTGFFDPKVKGVARADAALIALYGLEKG